jgi:hypothetical protein
MHTENAPAQTEIQARDQGHVLAEQKNIAFSKLAVAIIAL